MADETNVQAEMPAEGVIIDHDAVEQEVEKKDETKPEGETEDKQAEEASETEGEAEGEEEGKDEEKPKKRSGIQRLKASRDALLAENAELMRRLETSQPKQDGDEEKPPKEEDFNGDWSKYLIASTAYQVRQDRKAEIQKENATKAQAEQASVWRDRMADHQERIEEAKEVITDFDAVLATAKGITIRDELGAEIVMSPKSADLQYHLAKHQDELHRLNALSGRELAKEIGRLEATLHRPSAKKQTSAPPPPSRVKGGASPVSQEGILDSWLAKTYGKK